jgi:hypothetical protein
VRDQRYRCIDCKRIFPGNRMFCIRCTQACIERAKERVPCGKGHTKAPERPCAFCPAPLPEPVTEAV